MIMAVCFLDMGVKVYKMFTFYEFTKISENLQKKKSGIS